LAARQSKLRPAHNPPAGFFAHSVCSSFSPEAFGFAGIFLYEPAHVQEYGVLLKAVLRLLIEGTKTEASGEKEERPGVLAQSGARGRAEQN
jgi:hypothetical protein